MYIHDGDISGNFMLATQKLNGENFGEWKRIAEIFLSAKNKLLHQIRLHQITIIGKDAIMWCMYQIFNLDSSYGP